MKNPVLSKRSFLMWASAAVFLPRSFAFGQTAKSSADSCPAQPIPTDVISAHLISAQIWLKQIKQSLTTDSLTNDADAPNPDDAVVVNAALNGKSGATAYEGLRGLSSYLYVLEAQARTTRKQFDKNLVPVMQDTRDRIDKVVGSYDDFIKAKQHKPKAGANEKDVVKYREGYEKAAKKVLMTVIDELDLRGAQGAKFLEKRLSPLLKLDDDINSK